TNAMDSLHSGKCPWQWYYPVLKLKFAKFS
ncbi:MAG: hypothetical protein JWO52_7527, partial [Gammaproteobacteria bacterium]|nr:hypothetical protein [Gammaproteobacteria bacterium]